MKNFKIKSQHERHRYYFYFEILHGS